MTCTRRLVLRSAAFVAAALLLLADPCPRALAAHTADHANDVRTSPRRGPGDAVELEAFIDGLMSLALEDKHIAGATVVVVAGGRLLLAKGYGYADVDRRIPVDPERTLFRIGSISKLFTSTAVMQLVEDGKLELDADVTRYLDFSIPATFAEPITLEHLLTHTAGFEWDGRDLFAEDVSGIVPLGRWLANHVPARVRPPGMHAAYTNYAMALAGYIVERASGMPWEDYLEQRVLAPLSMTRTTGRQPLPAPLLGEMAQGYEFLNGRFESRPWEVIAGAAPAGSITTTGTDMARFMLAHLQGGEVGGRRVARKSTLERMHTRSFGHDSRLPGLALGFYERTTHGLRILGHAGATRWFHSDLALIPSEQVGLFVAFNSAQGADLTNGSLLRSFLDHYYAFAQAPALLPANAAQPASAAAGEYWFNRMSYRTFQKAATLFATVRIQANRDGSLLLRWPLEDMRLLPIAPLIYRDELGRDLVAFDATKSGRVTHAYIGSIPFMALERVRWHQSAQFHWLLLAVALAVFVATLLSALGRLGRRLFRWSLPPVLAGRSWVVGLALADVGFALFISVLASDPYALLSGPAIGLKSALALPVIGALLTVPAAIHAVGHWRQRAGTAGQRIRYTGVVLVSLVFLWSLSQWNLLGWRL
jgi:CubicO group peptidase (beta-lactamase class C family)